MSHLNITENLANRLQALANQQGTTVNQVLESMLATPQPPPGPTLGDEVEMLAQIAQDLKRFKQNREMIDVDKFRLLTENLQDIICLHAPDSTYLYVSPSVERVLGYEPAQLTGRTLYDFVHPDDMPLVRDRAHLPALQGEASHAITYRFRHADGDYIWLETNIQTVYQPDGEVYRLVTASRDATQHVEAEYILRDSERLLHHALNALPDPLVILDEEGCIVAVNHLWQQEMQAYGIAYETGQHLLDVMPHTGEVHDLLHMMLSGEIETSRTDFTDGDRWYHVRIVRFQHKNRLRLIYTQRDITDRKHIESDIRTSLEAERHLNMAKTQFLSMLSHEFRTPLASIMASSELLERYDGKMDSDQRVRHLHRIQAQVNHLISMVDDVLTLSRADTVGTQTNLEAIDLKAFAEHLLADIRALATRRHNLIFQHNRIPDDLIFDKTLLQQMLSNLLVNAIKYSPSGGEIRLTIDVNGRYVTFRIEDEGIGIPEKDMNNLYEGFFRASNTRSIPGTGMGMAIIKRAVEAHGGTIHVESEVNVGTTVTIKLPKIVAATRHAFRNDSANSNVASI